MQPIFRRTPAWSALRAVGNSVPVRLTLIIPLVGYLIIFNEFVVQYLSLAGAFGDPPAAQGATVSLRLLLVYFGLCWLALGSSVFTLFCPPEIKNYATAAAYVGGDGPNIGDVAFEPIEGVLRKERAQDYMRIRDRYDPMVPFTGLLNEADQRERSHQANNAILHLYYEQLKETHRVVRVFATVSFCLGFLFLLLPSVDVFLRAARILARTLATWFTS